MKKQKRYLYLDSNEYSVVLNSLLRFKNKLIKQGRYTDIVDETIIALMKAPVKKLKTT